jgi:hypothetical protein
MNFVTKHNISRRALLRSAGVSLAMPLLESMLPPLTAQAKTPVTRLGFVYVPHGAVMEKFTPATIGANFEFSPILKPLEPFRERVAVISGLDNKTADNAGVHSLGPPTWLSGVRPAAKEGDIRAGTTADQIAAAHLGQATQFPSLELATEDHSNLIGACDGGYSCTYINTISWRTPTTPLPMEINPRIVFERLFGEGGSRAQRLARVNQDRSILDAITGQANKLKLQLPSPDRYTLDQYLENVREIERRIQLAEKASASSIEVPSAPAGVPETFEDHVKLMFDLQALAWQTDITRVSTFMMARELSQRTYPQVGAPDPHHSISHHEDRQEKLEALARIQQYHAQLFAYFLDKLRTTADGEGSLLDHSLIMYGSNMSNSNLHNHFPLPVVVAGRGSGRFQGNRHLRYADRTPMTNLLLGLLNKLNVPIEQLGDSTGAVADL